MFDNTMIEKRRKNDGGGNNHNKRTSKNTDRIGKDRPSRFNSKK